MRSGDDDYARDYTESIKTEIARLEDEGKWKTLVASTFSDYILQKAGDLYIFQVLWFFLINDVLFVYRRKRMKL